MSSSPELIFRTDDGTKWGSGKGSPLRPDEVDNNFWTVLAAIINLQDNPVQPYQISNIVVSGNTMTIELSDSVTTFGPFILPVAMFNFTGAYVGNFDYEANDLFVADGGMYWVVRAVTSEPTFNAAQVDGAGAVFQLVFPYSQTLDIGFFWPGLPGTGISSGKPIFAMRAARAFYLEASLPGSVFGLDTATTGSLSFPLQKNGTVIGSLDIGAGQTVPAVTFNSTIQFYTGDILKVMRPTAVDATAADFTATFVATRGDYEAASSEAASDAALSSDLADEAASSDAALSSDLASS